MHHTSSIDSSKIYKFILRKWKLFTGGLVGLGVGAEDTGIAGVAEVEGVPRVFFATVT